MSYRAEVKKDSTTERGERLVTFEVELPRIVLAEYNTHRVLSRNSASSRAIPVKKQIARVMSEPFIPDEFGRNKSGMSPDLDRPLTDKELFDATNIWLEARDTAVEGALTLLLGKKILSQVSKDVVGKTWPKVPKKQVREALIAIANALPADLANDEQVGESLGVSVDELLNIHKQYPNRLLEPFMWHTIITTGTEWGNFFALRTDANAQREIQIAARLMKSALLSSESTEIAEGQWHLPLLDPSNEIDAVVLRGSIDEAKLVSIGRCARVSYMTHDGKRDPVEDIKLARSLAGNGHMSPFEHVARPMTANELRLPNLVSNFRGWVQARKEIPNEDDFTKTLLTK